MEATFSDNSLSGSSRADNPYRAPAVPNVVGPADDTTHQPGIPLLTVIVLTSVAAAIVAWYLSVVALILWGAMSGDPFFTVSIGLALFLPLVTAFQTARITRRILHAGYRRFLAAA